MAEVLGVVASGISVVQIAVQVVDCIQKLRAFRASMRDAPDELDRILNEVQVLGEVFCQLEGMEGCQPPFTAMGLLQASLSHCKEATAGLENLASSLKHPLMNGKRGRPWHLMKAALRKKDLKELRENLEAAKSLLQLAVTCYSIAVQQKHLTLLGHQETSKLASSRILPPLTRDGLNLSLLSLSQHDQAISQSLNPNTHYNIHQQRRLPPSIPACTLKKCVCSCHGAVSISGGFWSLSVPTSLSFTKACDRRSCLKSKCASLWICLNQIGISYAFLARLDITWSTQYSHISPSLHMQRVVNWDSPAYKVIRDLRWRRNPKMLTATQTSDGNNEVSAVWHEGRDELIRLFESGKASPRDILPDGKSFPEALLTLPWPNHLTQMDLLELLVKMGSEISTSRVLYSCIGWNGLGIWEMGKVLPACAHHYLLAKLTQLGFDPSDIEAPNLVNWPSECSPKLVGRFSDTEDIFFIDWMTAVLKTSPGFSGMSPLHEAILMGSRQDVENQLEKFSGHGDENLLYFTPVHLAVWCPRHLDTLLNAGLDVNGQDWNGRTPLIYTAAIGATETALKLLAHGADPWINDLLYANESFIDYAVSRHHWNFIIEAVDFVCQSPRFTKAQAQSLLDDVIIEWACEFYAKRYSMHFQRLLEYGANPNILFDHFWGSSQELDNTLLHFLDKASDVDVLVAKGFSKFNHSNSDGAHPLLKVVTEGQNPSLWRKLIQSGCLVNHQNDDGRSALHVTIKLACAELFSNPRHECCSGAFQSIELLLSSGADPLLGDFCQCACSGAGCTPLHVLKNVSRFPDPLSLYVNMIWTLEWVEMVQCQKGEEFAKRCLLDCFRMMKFEDLELTHTCCKQNWYGDCCCKLEDEEVIEIMDEEKHIIAELQAEMVRLQDLPRPDLSRLWIMSLVGRGFELAARATNSKWRPHLSQLRLTRVAPGWFHNYAQWVEFERDSSRYDQQFRDRMYEMRVGWIAILRAALDGG